MMTDSELWAAFHDRTLPAKDWTHEAHLRVAYLYRRRYSLDEAHLLFRIHLIRLNMFHEVPESKDRGYHETLTRGWLAAVGGIMVTAAVPVAEPESQAPDSLAFIGAHVELNDRKLLLRHYSRDRIHSVEARSRWLEPDLAPFQPS